MLDTKGWIKSHRKILDWEWFTDPPTAHLFNYLIHAVNYKDKKWQGTIIKRGQIVTSRKGLSFYTGLSERQIRTSLEKLKSTSEIMVIATSRFTLVTVVNYDKYQVDDEIATSQMSNERPTNDQPSTTTKELKEHKEINNKELSIVSHCEDQKPKRKRPLPTVVDKQILENFECLWTEYGKIGTKEKAKQAYLKIIKEGITHEEIIAGARRYISQCIETNRGQEFIMHLSTFLSPRTRGWESEHPIYTATKKPTAHDNFDKGIQLAINMYNERLKH